MEKVYIVKFIGDFVEDNYIVGICSTYNNACKMILLDIMECAKAGEQVGSEQYAISWRYLDEGLDKLL